MGLACTDEEAARHVTETVAREDLDCSVSAAEAWMEIPAKVKPFIDAEAIAVNAKTAVEIEASSSIAMGGARNP